MKKFMPLRGNIGKGFARVWWFMLFLIVLLWFISYEAKRVHTELYSQDSTTDGRVTHLEEFHK